MISQIYRSLLTIGLISIFSFTLVFGAAIENSWATTSINNLVEFSQTPITSHIASINKVKAVTKDIEGKAQEAIGDVTGDVKNQAAGKAKQAEANVRNSSEDIKNKVKDLANGVKDKAKDFNRAID